MKRNYDLIRDLLLELEGEQIDLNSYSKEQVLYHKAYLCKECLAEGKLHYPSTTFSEIPDHVILRNLTAKGHDLIDEIKDENKWNKVKTWIKDAGKTISIELIKIALTKIT